MSTPEFLTIREAAEVVRVSPKRLRNLMCSGVLIEGVHFSRPRGIGPRFKRQALIDWLDPTRVAEEEPIPMARGRRGRLVSRPKAE